MLYEVITVVTAMDVAGRLGFVHLRRHVEQPGAGGMAVRIRLGAVPEVEPFRAVQACSAAGVV